MPFMSLSLKAVGFKYVGGKEFGPKKILLQSIDTTPDGLRAVVYGDGSSELVRDHQEALMRSLIAIVLAVCCCVIPARAAEPPLVSVEIYSGIYLDLPGDWLIGVGGKVKGTATALAGKWPPPESADFKAVIYPPGKEIPAVFYLSVWLAEATQKDCEPGQFDKTVSRLLKLAEAGVSETVGNHKFTLKSPVRVERVSISGRPAFTSHAVGHNPHQPDTTDDGILICAGNALIGITASKKGNAPDAWAQLDRVRASLRLAATVPRAKKPWESAPSSGAAPSAAPSSAQTEADRTVWRFFFGLSKDAPQAAPAAEAWQSSWDVFASEVQAMYARKAPREEFIKRFNGKSVVWEGEVGSIAQMLREGVRVRFTMPEHTIRLPDGLGYRLNQLMLTLPNGSTIDVDTKLRFRATLSGGADPAVSAVALPDGKTRVIKLKTTGLAEFVK
jgi:hypothetical protein